MVYLYAVIVLVVNFIGLVLTLLGLPGNWLMIAVACLFTWITWAPPETRMFGVTTLIIALVLAAIGELIEFFAGMAGASKAGGSKLSAWLALGGGIIGGLAGVFIPVPVIGPIIGACLGAFAGAFIGEMHGGQTLSVSLQRGQGAAVGRILGTDGTLAVGVVIYIQLAVAAFWR